MDIDMSFQGTASKSPFAHTHAHAPIDSTKEKKKLGKRKAVSIIKGGDKLEYMDVSHEGKEKEKKHHASTASSSMSTNKVAVPSVGEEASFMDMIQSFAQLDTREIDPKQPETCPVCAKIMILDEFAPHVMDCIQLLEAEEKKAQAQLDEKMARSLADDRAEAEAAQYAANPRSECKAGDKCSRRDFGHFMMLKHPQVHCPVCTEGFEVYEIDAHLSICLSSEQRRVPSAMMPQPLSLKRVPTTVHMSLDTSAGGKRDEKKRAPGSQASKSGLSQQSIVALARAVLYNRRKNAEKDARAKTPTATTTTTLGGQDTNMLDLLDSFSKLGFTRQGLSVGNGNS